MVFTRKNACTKYFLSFAALFYILCYTICDLWLTLATTIHPSRFFIDSIWRLGFKNYIVVYTECRKKQIRFIFTSFACFYYVFKMLATHQTLLLFGCSIHLTLILLSINLIHYRSKYSNCKRLISFALLTLS